LCICNSDIFIRIKFFVLNFVQSETMIFSKACEYGIRAAAYIALNSLDNIRSSLKDISSEIGSPEAYTAKILQMLVRGGIIISIKGAAGGFEIDEKRMDRIRLGDIVMAIDGGFDETICVLGLKECSRKHPCPVHDKYKHIKKDLKSMLQNTSLKEMSEGLKSGATCLTF
jgi:Rrf2 family transcriptional regulator, iron-sulfur cluster assembly transcription factor